MGGGEVTLLRALCGSMEEEVRGLSDHDPPHCHVRVRGHDTQINLWTLEVISPPPTSIPPGLRKCLERDQVEMLRAWDEVNVIPPGSNTTVW